MLFCSKFHRFRQWRSWRFCTDGMSEVKTFFRENTTFGQKKSGPKKSEDLYIFLHIL